MSSGNGKFRFSIDRGGTFTDIYAEVPGEPGYIVYKLLSEDPANYDDAPREGIRRIIEKVLGKPIPTAQDIDTSLIDWIRMGTTVATNALLERKGEPCLLVITKGFRDVLKIGNQSRPKIFDLEIKQPELLYTQVIEVDERVRIVPKDEATENGNATEIRRVKGVSGETVEILQEPNYNELRAQLERARKTGLKSIAVVLLHAYTFQQHEEQIGKIAREVGFEQISLSSQVMPMVRIVPRGLTTCVDAYLTPKIRTYIDNFAAGFKDSLKGVNVTFMQSDGGLTSAGSFNGSRAILSGPAGGVVGYAMTTYNQQTKKPVIGFDMGGTSTDVSRYAGQFEHVYETQLAGVTIQAPQLDITTVAAGGGSRLFFKSGLFVVGPESAGAHPGPVCYRKGGPLAITDANVFLGRVIPEYFPHIFGPQENEPLDYEATKQAFLDLTAEINAFLAEQARLKGTIANEMTPEQVAHGFIRVANEAMCRPIRAMTVAKGYDTRNHVLSCFGGAGPQHACAIAKSLGIKEIFIHRFSGILSAYGIGMADVVHESQEPCALEYKPENTAYFAARFDELKKQSIQALVNQQFSEDQITCECFLNLRYQGTDYGIMVLQPEDGDFAVAFKHRYEKEYGFTLPGRSIIVDDIRVRGLGHSGTFKPISIPAQQGEPQPINFVDTYFDEGGHEAGRIRTPVYNLGALGHGAKIAGPAIIIHDIYTIVLVPHSLATITEAGDVRIVLEHTASAVGTELDSVQLSIFSHRFMSIAEQMGRTLQRTSISTNIKERLDFSCALFGPNGGLVANAPHLPVHLGSMSEAVKFQIKYLGDDWKEGEVIVSNHPVAGGSHLPDITVITPVFKDGKPVFYVASRGHHADIGGITPGSMPPFSRSLSEEGAHIKSFKLVKDGVFQTEGITKLLDGTRCLQDNLSDLQAQVAANQKGISLVYELIAEYGLDVVQAYMFYVQHSAELAVRDMLERIGRERGTSLYAEDSMDDGSRIRLKIDIDMKTRSAKFDFSGTDPMVMGNINAPPSVTYSAILYCLRCLVNEQEMPLNEGCLTPIEIYIPQNSLLKPADEAAVVGGNVLTSQRVTDIILKAFGACAASQGCMNNLTFGNARFGYYETIAGGAGAGPTWHGQSAVHTHMTNTRITDAEILERRYPVLLREFSIRHGSGGIGKFNGGDGVIREIEFLEPLSVGILSERRVFAPFGLEGGGDAARGVNHLIMPDGKVYNLGGKNTCKAERGARIRILTPGGGGYGKPEEASNGNNGIRN